MVQASVSSRPVRIFFTVDLGFICQWEVSINAKQAATENNTFPFLFVVVFLLLACMSL
jgi:hypothetical protein